MEAVVIDEKAFAAAFQAYAEAAGKDKDVQLKKAITAYEQARERVAFEVTGEEAAAIAKAMGWESASPAAARCHINTILAARTSTITASKEDLTSSWVAAYSAWKNSGLEDDSRPLERVAAEWAESLLARRPAPSAQPWTLEAVDHLIAAYEQASGTDDDIRRKVFVAGQQWFAAPVAGAQGGVPWTAALARKICDAMNGEEESVVLRLFDAGKACIGEASVSVLKQAETEWIAQNIANWQVKWTEAEQRAQAAERDLASERAAHEADKRAAGEAMAKAMAALGEESKALEVTRAELGAWQRLMACGLPEGAHSKWQAAEKRASELDRKLDAATKCATGYRVELEELRTIHDGAVRYRIELADANSGLRLSLEAAEKRAANLERELDQWKETATAANRAMCEARERAAELERERDEARSLANALEHAAQLTEEEYMRLEDDDDAAGDVLTAVQERLMFAQAKHRTQSTLAQESAKPAEPKPSWLRETIDEARASNPPLSDFAEREIAKIRAQPKPGDVLSGEAAKAYMLANPGRRVAHAVVGSEIFDGYYGEIARVQDGTLSVGDNIFCDGTYRSEEFTVLPPEPTKPAPDLDLAGSVELLRDTVIDFWQEIVSGTEPRAAAEFSLRRIWAPAVAKAEALEGGGT